MSKIRTEIEIAASKSSIVISRLTDELTNAIKLSILRKYADRCLTWPTWIWEHTSETSTLVSEEGWRLIADFSPSDEVVMMFAPSDEPSAFKIPTGKDASAILSECFAFEVYFTNLDTDFLLGHNHHDCAFACGRAKHWLEVKARQGALDETRKVQSIYGKR